MRYEVKSIGMWPFIKVSFFFNLIVGFIFGLLYAVFAGFIMTIMSRLSQFQPGGFDFDMEPLPIGLMIVVLPIVMAVLGAIFYTIIGVVLALIYNLIAKIVGSYEFVLEPVAAEASSAPPGQPLAGYTGIPPYVPPIAPSTLPPATPSPATPQAAPPPTQPTAPSGTPRTPPPDTPQSRKDARGTDQDRPT